jgi:predicted permease
VTQLLLLKLLLLPALMVGLTQLCGMRDEYGLGLVLLASYPLAQLAFLMCHQYHTGVWGCTAKHFTRSAIHDA